MRKIIDKKYIPLYFICFIIILFSHLTIDPVLLPRFVSLSAFLIVFIVFLFFSDQFSVQINIFFILFLAYIFYSSITVLYSINKADALFEVSKQILFFSVIYTFTIFYKDNKRIIKNFSKIISIINLIILIIGLYQIFSIEVKIGFSHINMYHIKSVFANKNIFAEIILLFFPISLYSFLYGNKLFKLTGIINIIFNLFFIIILLSRSSWVAFASSIFVTSLFLILFLLKYLKKIIKRFAHKKITWISIFSFIAVIIISVSLYSKKDSIETFEKQISTFTDIKRINTEDRIQLWKKTILLIKENPVLGKGLSSWKIEILKYGNHNLHSEDNKTFYQRPHNDYLWILAEQGLIGLLLYISLFFILFYYIIKIIKKTDKEENKIFFILISWILFSFMLISVFSFPKERIEHNIFLSLISALIIIYYNKQKTKKLLILNNNQIKKTLFILLPFIIFSFFIGIIRIKGEFYLKKAFYSRAENNYQNTVKNINKSNSIFYRSDPFSTPLIWYEGEANFLLKNYNTAFLNFKTAYKENPYHIHVLNNLASCYELKQNHSEALKYYKKALNIAPGFEESLLNICAVYYNIGESDTAFYYLNKVDTSSKNIKYQQFMYPVLYSKINSILMNTENITQKKNLLKIQNNENQTKNIYLKSIKNKIDFKKQLFLDINSIIKQDRIINKD